MRILHLFADSKLTGPAQPTIDLCVELRRRGLDVEFACRPDPSRSPATTVRARARQEGLDPIVRFELAKRMRLVSNLRDARNLSRWIDDRRIDLVHAHTSIDHLIAGFAARGAKRRPPVVRTNHTPRPLSRNLGSRLILTGLTDGYLCFSSRILAEESSLSARVSAAIDPCLPLDRYPGMPRSEPPRRRFGVGPDEFLFGMVMRVQAHRRFDVVIDAVERAKRSGARCKVLVVGRGTRRRELAVDPVRRRGLQDTILFAGYVSEGYLETLAAFDAMIFLKAGSDGTARALREVQLIGRPAIVSREGLLPELVQEGETGVVTSLDPEEVARAIERMSGDPEAARRMGAAARKQALHRYDLGRGAARIEEIYRTLLGKNKNEARAVTV
jgi:glycosyltransferase involved in cell wall biosynthesis